MGAGGAGTDWRRIQAYEHLHFPKAVREQALKRQRKCCACCGIRVTDVGEAGMANHRFGERVEGHHVIPHKMEDSITVESCVVIRRSCHISVQQGGAWRDVSIYEDIETLPMPTRIMRISALYLFYRG